MTDENNRRRWRSILIARDVKHVFMAVPEMLAGVLAHWCIGWVMRAMFLGTDGKPHRGGEVVLAEIRRITLLDRTSVFDTDPLVMAYREGKRSVGLQIMAYLNLDENEVRKLMEIDSGL